MNNRISYKEFESYPKFESRYAAVKWLKEKYGEDFFFSKEGELDNEPYYIYTYILNKEVFDRMLEYMRKNGREGTWYGGKPETKGFRECSQEILIWENGKVQVQSLI
ncbi:hypothetical protein [Bacillus pretiosus]|uniref:hypothetical protein n=1 Tax=Bacillus pretiosus TaxID=2983392 RepID=UPI002EDB6FEB